MLTFVLIFLTIATFGLYCWFVFELVVYAQPIALAVTASGLAYDTGSGLILAAVVGAVVFPVTFVVGTIVFTETTARSSTLRSFGAFILAGPAAVVGYYFAMDVLSEQGVSWDGWRQIISLAVGAIPGFIAWSRYVAYASAQDPLDVGRHPHAS